jgi:co-chaperonin GroES (HSP10)
MTGPLFLPKHVMQARKQQQEASAANSITKTSVNHLTSDDFVTPDEVIKQLADLYAYIALRQETDPKYGLPAPLGWRLTVLMLTIPETTAGGLHMVDDMREARAMSSPQGVVLNVGSSCYQDKSRFALDGEVAPWVGVGDRILWKKYDVSTFQIANGQRLGFMNDTQPLGVIDGGWIKQGEE